MRARHDLRKVVAVLLLLLSSSLWVLLLPDDDSEAGRETPDAVRATWVVDEPYDPSALRSWTV